MLKLGCSKTEISIFLGRNRWSTISREIKRNSDKRNNVYRYELADKKYHKWQIEKPKHIRFYTYLLVSPNGDKTNDI